MADDIDTTNKFMVGVRVDKIIIMMPPRRELSKADALNLAAWLVTLADDEPPHKFLSIVEAIQNT